MKREDLKNNIENLIMDSTFPIHADEAIGEISDRIINFLVKQELINLTFTPPTVEEAKNYLIEKELVAGEISITEVIANDFINYYSSVGWTVGKLKKPMKSWKKALNTFAKKPWNVKKSGGGKVNKQMEAYMKLQKQMGK